jgi:hypothetical protein
MIGIRWLRYAGVPLGPNVDRALRELMVFEAQAFLWSWAYTRFEIAKIALVAGVLVIGLHRRAIGRLVHRGDGTWLLTPAAASLLLGGMVVYQYVFDLNPTVALVCAESLILLAVTSHPRVAAALPRPLRLGLWGVAFVWWLVTAGDPVERLTIVTWAAFLVATERYLTARMGRADVALLRMAAVLPANLLPAMLPLFVPLHGGVRLGDGLAYAFCESPDRPRLYASIPVCDSVWQDYEHCRDGAIAEYDMSTMRRVATHRFFTPDYYGRFEMVVCPEGEVLATVHGAVDHGEKEGQSVLSFSTESPETFNGRFAKGIGSTIAYDPVHDFVFYSAEFDERVVRYDRRTKRSKESWSPELRNDWVQPIALTPFTGSQSLDSRSVHPGRNRIYVTQDLQGRYTHAVDLTTLKVVARYDVGGGGAFGVAVDADRDRLFVSSLWGLEIFDLTTDRLITRKRIGLGNRPVIVDAARNRLYVSSEVEGKIRVLDRDTLAVIGQLPIGIGSRFAWLSRDGKHLFASSATAHYSFDPDTLVSRR